MIIGISGKKQAGKDEVASILLAQVKNSVRIGFASFLKQEVARGCNVSLEFIETNKSNFRLILQGWGTDFRRKLYGENFWTDKMASAIDTMQTAGVPLIVIPDVRFKNEYAMIKKHGGILVRVERTREGAADMHISETDLDNAAFDITIDNNGTLAELKQKVKAIIK